MRSPAQSDAISISQLLTEVADTTQKMVLLDGILLNDLPSLTINISERNRALS